MTESAAWTRLEANPESNAIDIPSASERDKGQETDFCPNGAAASSPGLPAAGRLPWVRNKTRLSFNPNGVAARRSIRSQPRWGRRATDCAVTQGSRGDAATLGWRP